MMVVIVAVVMMMVVAMAMAMAVAVAVLTVSRVRMVVVDSQNAQADRWRSHTRDLRRDWADAFGGTMPRVGGVAVGADTDNTGDQVTAWFGDLRLEAQA